MSSLLHGEAHTTDRAGSVPGINAVPHEDNLRYFDVTIHGPAQSPYEGNNPLRDGRTDTEVLQEESSEPNSSYQMITP